MKNISFLSLIIALALISCQQQPKQNQFLSIENNWKFKTGDNPEWAKPDFDDSTWDSISPYMFWEQQGYEDYDGFAWYRTSVIIPSSIKKEALINDSIIITLGKVDDTDETFLNGELIGVNNIAVPVGTISTNNYIGNSTTYSIPRRYKLSVNDPRIKWDEENVIAVRANDHYLGGGIKTLIKQNISMLDVKNYLIMDLTNPFELLSANNFKKSIKVKNTYTSGFKGKLVFKIKDLNTKKITFETSEPAEFKVGEEKTFEFEYSVDQTLQYLAIYEFIPNKSPSLVSNTQEMPYFLTPVPGDEPKINGALIYGQTPNKPFLYAIPVTGVKPIEYGADNLPKGLACDTKTGIITGSVATKGEYKVIFKAKNSKGETIRNFTIVIGDKLALTPPMGWNSWNAFGLDITEEKVRISIDQFIDAGLKDHGYSFVNMDDGWEAAARTNDGRLLFNDKFTDIKALSDYAHSKGLKLGIYSSPGETTCGGYLSSYKHEMQDAQQWADWGIDYIKYDWCSYRDIAKDESLEELQKPYTLMKECLDKTDRDIVYSLCQYGMGDVWEWGEEVGGQLWRTTDDIIDTWLSLSEIGFGQAGLSKYAKPGYWNDPDMMIVGWVGWNNSIQPTRLTVSEQYTHVTLWSVLAAPLLLGNDLSKLDDFTINLITNDEVIAVNQDPLGKQGDLVKKDGDIQIWSRQLVDGSQAIAIFNMSTETIDYELNLAEINVSNKVKIRDIWRQKDLGEYSNSFKSKILSHGVTFVKVTE